MRTKCVPLLSSYSSTKNHLIELQELLEHFCNVLVVFGFKRAKKDLILINSFLLPTLVNERYIEPAVIKKANQFISFKCDKNHLSEKKELLGDELFWIHSWRHIKPRKEKIFFLRKFRPPRQNA